MGIWKLVLILVMWGAAIALAVWIVRCLFRSDEGGSRRRTQRSDPQAELDARLVRGEIDRREYRCRRAALEAEPDAAPPVPPPDG